MKLSENGESLHALYLQEITIDPISNRKLSLSLRNEDGSIGLRRESDTAVWKPLTNLELVESSSIALTIKGEHKFVGLRVQRPESRVEITGQELTELFWEGKDRITVQSSYEVHHILDITFSFRPSNTSELVRSSVHRLQGAMNDYHPFLSGNLEKQIDRVFKFAMAFSELNPIAKAAFSVANETFNVLKEQQKVDHMVADLAKSIQRLLPFINDVAGNIVWDGDTNLLKQTVLKMFKLIDEAASYICQYVKRSFGYRVIKFPIFLGSQNKINHLDEEFSKLKEDFDRALNVEIYNEIKDNEYRRILERLKSAVYVGHDEAGQCMAETRGEILTEILEWSGEMPTPDESDQLLVKRNVFWIHGTPGIGKTAISNSLCASLHQERRLGGSFFCKRDDSYRSNSKYVLPALVYQLAGVWAPYGKSVAQVLAKDPQISPETPSMIMPKLLLDPLASLQRHPPNPIVIIIDALDECGDDSERKQLLQNLLSVAAHCHWIKIVITSRPEQEVQLTFRGCKASIRNLAEDQVGEDIWRFARNRLADIASRYELGPDWPDEAILQNITDYSGGLFMFVETVYQFIKDRFDPVAALTQILDEQLSVASRGLDELYHKVVDLAVKKEGAEVETCRTVIGAIIAVAGNWPLGDQALAALLGLKPYSVKVLVKKLGSLFHHGDDGGIRARHSSIAEFFTKSTTDPLFRVDLKETHVKLGSLCLSLMTKELKFNICQLETSSIPNSQVKDLENQIRMHISDALKYSCLYWPTHLCSGQYLSDSTKGELQMLLGGKAVLYWIEVLSLTGNVHGGLSRLRELTKSGKNLEPRLQALVTDTLRFLTAFYIPITTSTPHIYVSALPFSPKQSLIRQNTVNPHSHLLNVSEGRLESWQVFPHIWHEHTDRINAITISSDGMRLASASNDKTIRLWDVDTGGLIGNPLRGHQDWIMNLEFSPDDQRIMSSARDGSVLLWDVQTGQPIDHPITKQLHGALSITYSTDGRQIAGVINSKMIKIFESQTGESVGQPLVGHTHRVNSLSFSPDSRRLASCSNDKTIRIWDIQTSAPICGPLTGHMDWVMRVGFSPDGGRIVSGCRAGEVCIWDVQTGTQIGKSLTGHSDCVRSVTFSPSGHRVLSSSEDETIQQWDAQTGQPVGEPWAGHTHVVACTGYSRDGLRAFSGSWDATIRVWDTQTGGPMGQTWTGHTKETIAVAYSSDGLRILSASTDKTIRIWNSQSGEPIGEPLVEHDHLVLCIAYSPNGRTIACGSEDRAIRVYEVHSRSPNGRLLTGHADWVTCVTFSPDGRRIVSGSRDKTLRVWDTQTDNSTVQALILTGHSKGVTSVACSPDGRRIASGSYDNTIRIWDIETGVSVGQPFIGHTEIVSSLIYSPNGNQLVSSSWDRTIRIWNLRTNTPEESQEQHGQHWQTLLGHTNLVNSVAFSPDGRQIVSGSDDKTLRLWDAATGKPIGHPLLGHAGSVSSVGYSPDGRYIISGSYDKTIRIWQVQDQSKVSAGLNAIANSGSRSMNLQLDGSGWVRDAQRPDEFLFWVPEHCRNGLICPAVITIPTNGRSRRVQVDISDMKYGSAWTEIL